MGSIYHRGTELEGDQLDRSYGVYAECDDCCGILCCEERSEFGIYDWCIYCVVVDCLDYSVLLPVERNLGFLSQILTLMRCNRAANPARQEQETQLDGKSVGRNNWPRLSQLKIRRVVEM